MHGGWSARQRHRCRSVSGVNGIETPQSRGYKRPDVEITSYIALVVTQRTYLLRYRQRWTMHSAYAY